MNYLRLFNVLLRSYILPILSFLICAKNSSFYNSIFLVSASNSFFLRFVTGPIPSRPSAPKPGQMPTAPAMSPTDGVMPHLDLSISGGDLSSDRGLADLDDAALTRLLIEQQKKLQATGYSLGPLGAPMDYPQQQRSRGTESAPSRGTGGPKLKDYLPFMKPATFGPKSGLCI